MRTQRRCKELVTSDRFFRRNTAELSVEHSRALGQEGGPHLQKTIRKTRFKDVARNRRELRLEADIGPLPELILATLKSPQSLWLLGAELHSPLGSEDLNKPGVSFARGQALHLKAEGNVSIFYSHICVQEGIVPGVARSHSTFAVGTFMIDFLQLSIDPHRIPAEPEWHVHSVHAEVAHHSDFSAGLNLTFPIHGLVRIEIAAVVKT